MGSVKVNFLSYCYRVDKSTIFGMRGPARGPFYQFWKGSHVEIK